MSGRTKIMEEGEGQVRGPPPPSFWMEGDAAVSPLPVILPHKGVTQLEGQYLLYFLVLSFQILSVYKSRIPLSHILEHFFRKRSSHAEGCGREQRVGLTQEPAQQGLRFW